MQQPVAQVAGAGVVDRGQRRDQAGLPDKRVATHSPEHRVPAPDHGDLECAIPFPYQDTR